MGERADEVTVDEGATRDASAETQPLVDIEETSEIRMEIELTRAEMSETIDALQERLSPQNLADQAKSAAADAATGAVESAKEAVRDATIGRAEHVVTDVTQTARETGSSLLDTLRDNPLPAALAGLGLGWLWMKRRRPAATQYRTNWYPAAGYGWQGDRPERYTSASESTGVVGHAQERAAEMTDQVRESVSHVASQTGDFVGDAGERLQDTGSSLWHTIQRNPLPAAMTAVSAVWLLSRREPETAAFGASPAMNYGAGIAGYERSDGMRETAREMGGQIRDVVDQAQQQVGNVGSTVQQQSRRAQSQMDRWLEENPLGVAAVALGLGTAVGLAVPATRQESELMGEARDTLMERARDVVQDTSERVQQVAQQATEAATEEARNQNLTA